MTLQSLGEDISQVCEKLPKSPWKSQAVIKALAKKLKLFLVKNSLVITLPLWNNTVCKKLYTFWYCLHNARQERWNYHLGKWYLDMWEKVLADHVLARSLLSYQYLTRLNFANFVTFVQKMCCYWNNLFRINVKV